MRTETRRCLYHSGTWQSLVECGWHTMTVDEPDQFGFRMCTMVWDCDQFGRIVR